MTGSRLARRQQADGSQNDKTSSRDATTRCVHPSASFLNARPDRIPGVRGKGQVVQSQQRPTISD